MEFSHELAIALYNSTEPFPVDFDDAWAWLGYFDKSTAKRALMNCDFSEDVDFRITADPTTTGISVNPKQQISLTVDCFKTWGMMAGTKQGKEV
ncbi:MAG TPA: hypothetical protein V6C57_01290, partial [Coleofasciculaceae cyanobacterium]